MAAAPSSISSSSVSSSLIMSSPSPGLKMACRRSLSGVASFHSHSAVDTFGPAARLFSTKREHLWWKNDWRLVHSHVCRACPVLNTRVCGNYDNLFSRGESRTQWTSRRQNSRDSGICGATTSSQDVSANKISGHRHLLTPLVQPECTNRRVCGTRGQYRRWDQILQIVWNSRVKEEVGRDVSIVNDMLNFLNESWTPFHATAEAKRQLLKAGFLQLKEEQEWAVQPGGRYFFTRNMSSIFAFAIGQKYEVGNGFHVVAAHTDSPCPKLKPVSAATKAGFLNVGVQTYGGGLWHTWFDRDLSVAGRVLLRRENGTVVQELLKVERPIMRIPTLAIHLDRTVNTDGFKPNLETHLAPVLATQIKAELLGKSELGSQIEGGNGALNSSKKPHHPLLLEVLAEQLNCSVEEIVDFELNVCDTQPSCLGGARKEFIFSGRLDNLASSYCALRALLDTCSDSASLADESCIRAIALFDNEEVGSDSAQGAGSPVMFQAMGRITRWLTRHTPTEGIEERTIRKSFLVSADMAHALHPNYTDRHEENHQPKLHEGLVIKYNANQRYATNTVTAFLFKEVAKVAGVPTQNFVVRNDMGCGSTIGPILASGIGIRTVDCGMPQLSMHSIREMCGAEDVDISYRHFKAFFELFTAIDKLNVDT